MDSGISNSVQSSSGGDEEYDSRADHSISSFFNNSNNRHRYPSSVPASGLHHQQQLYPYSLSDHPFPSANYSFDPSSLAKLSSSSQLPNSSSLLNNLDHVFWSRSLRSDSNCSDLGGAGLFMNPSTTTSTAPSTSSKASSFLAPPASSSSGGADGLGLEPQQQQGHYKNNKQSQSHTQPNHHVVRNPKKRSRASRRAPTTVLTTDTSNFRAMVQEFTGTPAPPFTQPSSLHFPRSIAATTISRLNDLFGASINSTSPAQPPPSSLLRPFPHKLNINNHPPIRSSSSAAAITSSTINNINYQPILQNLLLNNLQNSNNNNDPVLSLHSLLQLPPTYPLPNESKSSGISLEDQFGLSQQAKLMCGLQSWPAAGTTPAAVGSNESTADDHHHRQEPASGVSENGKLLSSFVSSQASSSAFLRGKQGQQAAANNVNGEVATTITTTTANTRTAGMVVESWID